jgi:hypothetical protein
MVTALPLLRAFLSRDMDGFEHGWAAASAKKQLSMVVLAAALVIRGLIETAVNTAGGGAATDDQVRREWERFMALRAASKRRK